MKSDSLETSNIDLYTFFTVLLKLLFLRKGNFCYKLYTNVYSNFFQCVYIY